MSTIEQTHALRQSVANNCRDLCEAVDLGNFDTADAILRELGTFTDALRTMSGETKEGNKP